MAEVRVAIYQAPSVVDLAHWAIEVTKEELEMIYQITGYASAFRFEWLGKKAITSKRFHTYVLITKDLKELESLHETICNTPVNNIDSEYNCQSWVIEALSNLNQAGLISEHEYLPAVANLHKVCGIVGSLLSRKMLIHLGHGNPALGRLESKVVTQPEGPSQRKVHNQDDTSAVYLLLSLHPSTSFMLILFDK
jgi:hypothetical protein